MKLTIAIAFLFAFVACFAQADETHKWGCDSECSGMNAVENVKTCCQDKGFKTGRCVAIEHIIRQKTWKAFCSNDTPFGK